MTLVFRGSAQGSLQQIQIGPIDLVATISAANSAWGWLGGLSRARKILNYFGDQVKQDSGVFIKPKLQPAACRVICFDGITTLPPDDPDTAFDGDYTTQMVAVTICALAFEIPEDQVIDIFMTYLLPVLFLKSKAPAPGLQEALHSQLVDNLPVILNEGAARGFTERFKSAVGALEVATAEGNWSNFEGWERRGKKFLIERYMIGGFLKWLGMGIREAYFTRSAAVARLAACLKDVGYVLTSVQKWDGRGSLPTLPRAVILVVGGVSKTDPFLEEPPYDYPELVLISHYQWSTTGAMFSNSLHTHSAIPPETFQQYFEEITEYIQANLSLHWKFRNTLTNKEGYRVSTEPAELHVYSQWKQPRKNHSRTALRLAAFYFPGSAPEVAPCYERIASEDTLQLINHTKDDDFGKHKYSENLIRFRVITASIIFASIGHIAGPDFHNIQHCTALRLQTGSGIHKLGGYVDKLMSSTLLYSTVASLISHIHCGMTHTLHPEPDDGMVRYMQSSVIGYRQGIYAVIPNLLLTMNHEPSFASLGFNCVDVFVGNIPTHRDGTITSGNAAGFDHPDLADRELIQQLIHGHSDSEAQLVQANQDAFLGPPTLRPPSVPLHLSIERPPDVSEPHLTLCGRVNGEVMGYAGVPAIITALALSLSHENATGKINGDCGKHATESHKSTVTVLNISTSLWVRSKARKPTGEPLYHTYIPVHNDIAWLLMLAAASRIVISSGCAGCAVDQDVVETDVKKYIIGYK
ncbi:MAG: hypothetical protein Q9187_006643 [Circinaria calcarea]